MAEVKWIKLTTDMFDNRKIKHLRRLPDGNNIVLIWVMLLTMAGRCNAGGMIFLTENIPYTPKMLADELGFEETTVQLAINALENFNMIVTNHGFFAIAGWEEYQNVDRLSELREYNRIAKQKSREKQKALQAPKADVNDKSMTSQSCQGTDIDKDKETDKELDKKKEKIDYQLIADMYNSICHSLPSVRSLSDARKTAIRARLKKFTVDDFKAVFQKAEASSFLKGENGGWAASFDWLIKEANMIKVLEDTYADKGKSTGRKENVPGWLMRPSMELGNAELEAIQKLLHEEPEEDFTAEAEQLRRELQASFGGNNNG